MSKSQRTKGAAGEREWCDVLKEFGFAAKRLLGQARDGGGDVPCPPFLYEVKRRKSLSVYKWLTQAEVSKLTTDCKIPVVAARADNKDWIVILSARDFLSLVTNKTV